MFPGPLQFRQPTRVCIHPSSWRRLGNTRSVVDMTTAGQNFSMSMAPAEVSRRCIIFIVLEMCVWNHVELFGT